MSMLQDKWVVWSHYSHDINWSLSSYEPIMEVASVDELVALLTAFPEKVITSSMLFFMRKGVTPMWEDARNRSGGCFSYKVSTADVKHCWTQSCYAAAGESIGNEAFSEKVNGISVSPKKGFSVLKIWMANDAFQSPSSITLKELDATGCIFKRHV
jgi:Eukaryotic initiation factor 4E